MVGGVILIGILLILMLISVAPKDVNYYTPKPKRRKYKNNSSSSPKALPWFDKDYLKRQERERNKYFWDDDDDKYFWDD